MPTNIALTGLTKDLAMRAATGQPIRIGLVGTGDMGTDIVSRVAQMQGIAFGAISELKPGAARKSVEIAYGNSDLVAEVTTADAANAAMEAVRVAVTDNGQALLDAGLIDVVVDATGIPAVGAEIGLQVMERGKHLVMMNGEADVTIGAYLRSEAERLGVVYSLGTGDEPSSCMELVEFVSAMGHRIISAGKGKNNPLNFDATPDADTEAAVRRHMNPRMLVEFVDGSKTMVEMAAIAIATGLTPDKPGMHGPACPRENLNKLNSAEILCWANGCAFRSKLRAATALWMVRSRACVSAKVWWAGQWALRSRQTVSIVLSSGAYVGSHSTLSQWSRAASAAWVALLVWIGPLSSTMTTGLWHWPGLGPS